MLSVSRHHFDQAKNAEIMHLDVPSESIALAFKESCLEHLQLRWVCVLQKGGIESKEDVLKYLTWTASQGVKSVCFKELYVSSSTESVYYEKGSNQYSYDRQISLSVVTELAIEQGWKKLGELPWGSPIFEVKIEGVCISVAAYTEPSVLWELNNGVCRSWNLMANGLCYASLERLDSEVMAV